MAYARMILTTTMICRETLRLMGRQLRPTDEAFDATFRVRLPSDEFGLSLNAFSDRYLQEVADTMINLPDAPVTRWRHPLPSGTDSAREVYLGIALRVVRYYEIAHDLHAFHFAVQYRPGAMALQEAA